METIYALSSGGLPSGVAVVRVSGPQCNEAVTALCGRAVSHRLATLKTIRRRNGEMIDNGLVLFFEAPSSFTGEDCVEFHLHGGRAVVKALLDELAMMRGFRHAESGEFSRRAFQNGKIDLLEVEGLADLIAAETDMQRRLALDHANGGQSVLYANWARRITHARAMIEAEIDFADEDDVPGSVSDVVWQDIRQLFEEARQHLERAPIGEIIRDGLKVAIVGAPNVGKSSFLNALAKRDVAIVTDIAGTTRDVLSVDLDLDGFAVKMYDTAGLRHTVDCVEAEGIRRARVVIAEADVVLLLSDGAGPDPEVGQLKHDAKTIRVRTKVDLSSTANSSDIGVSSVTGAGLDDLVTVLKEHLGTMVSSSVSSMPTRLRHVQCLTSLVQSLEQSLRSSEQGLDIQAEFLRQAAHELGRITGRVDVENLLDVIFSTFCVGK